MSLPSDDILRELELLPMWISKVAQAPSPATTAPFTEADIQAVTLETNEINEPLEPLADANSTSLAEEQRDSDLSEAALSETNAGEGASATDASNTVPPNLNRSLLDKTIGEVRSEQIMRLDWQGLQHCVHECTSCHLSADRTQTVFGSGDLQADWLLVGDAPSTEDDFSGEPFSGEVGQLLDNMLAAIKLKRHDQVYLSHAIHCKPPENRKPLPDEVALCAPYLQRQVALIQPKIIIAFGAVAAESLLSSQRTLTELRGQTHNFLGIPVIVTHHPAHLLQHPQDKAQSWSDLCLAVNTMQGLQI